LYDSKDQWWISGVFKVSTENPFENTHAAICNEWKGGRYFTTSISKNYEILNLSRDQRTKKQ